MPLFTSSTVFSNLTKVENTDYIVGIQTIFNFPTTHSFVIGNSVFGVGSFSTASGIVYDITPTVAKVAKTSSLDFSTTVLTLTTGAVSASYSSVTSTYGILNTSLQALYDRDAWLRTNAAILSENEIITGSYTFSGIVNSIPIKNMTATTATIVNLAISNINATTATVTNSNLTNINATTATIVIANITNLTATTSNITNNNSNNLTATTATIINLSANYATETVPGLTKFASSDETKVKTSTTYAVTPSGLAATKFVSAPITWVQSSIITVNHGLGAIPFNAFIVAECIIPELGYSVGERVYNVRYWDQVNPTGPLPVIATNISIMWPTGDSAISVLTKTGGMDFTGVNRANWRFYLCAEL